MSTTAEISAAWIERANTMARVVVPLQPTRKLLRDKNTSARLQLRALKPTCPARDSLESQITSTSFNLIIDFCERKDVSYALTDGMLNSNYEFSTRGQH
jgi:hypothetical protein